MKNIQSFVWLKDQAEDAAKLYTSAFRNAKIISTMPGNTGLPGVPGAGKPMGVTVEVAGHQLVLFNGGPAFHPTAAISYSVYPQSESEIDSIWKKLSDGGSIRMELQKYPFSEKYGWVEDRFGVNWQLSLSNETRPTAPSFMFCGAQQGNAEKAINFWTEQFPNSKVNFAAKYEKGHEFEGQIMFSNFTLNGQSFNAMDAGRKMDIPFSQGISIFVNCETQAEIDGFWNNLSQGGRTDQCGWLADQFGVWWQIVPTALGRLLASSEYDKDRKKAGRAMQAMMKMTKFDIAELERAYSGQEVEEPALS